MNRVVGGKHEGQRIGVGITDQKRGDRRGGSRVAADRLQNDTGRTDLDLAQLLGDQEPMVVAANDERRGEDIVGRETQRRFLHHGALRNQWQ